jgi:hypothetical protein
LVRIETELLIRFSDLRPLWLTDVLRVYRPGSHTAVLGDYRIIEIPEIEIIQEDDDRGAVRRAVYVARLL